MSAGEYQVKKVLNEMKIEHVYDASYELKNPDTGAWLRWDFNIECKNTHLFIEFDGKQHFVAQEHFGGEAQLKKQQANDQLKNEYCAQHGYPLLRIPYTEYGNIRQLVSAFIIEHSDWDGDNRDN